MLNQFDIARWQWPGATVVAATFDQWWAAFQDAVPQLPVTTQEMGETWLTGFASDPFKMAFYRTAAREYTSCLNAHECDGSDSRITHFLRMLMKMPEHTWGLPTIGDDENYTNAEFHVAQAAGVQTYVNSESSWNEQRVVGTQYALQALQDHPLAARIAAAAQELVPVKPAPAADGFTAIPLNNASDVVKVTYNGGSVALGFDQASGALNYLSFNGGASVASPSHLLGQFVYQTVNDTDINRQHVTLDNGTNGCCCCYGCVQGQGQGDGEGGGVCLCCCVLTA